ncbi:MAG: hypothetical protein ACXWJZ_14050, partial [Burkholderiaceae bacterium]
QSAETNDLTVKLIALYDLNKSYISEAEKFLSPSSREISDGSHKKNLTREDIDRLYSHIYVLEHIAKLLYEEFLIDKNGGLPEWSEEKFDRRKTQMQK